MDISCNLAALYRERRDVAITLANTEVVLGTLSLLVGCILHLCAGFAYLYIFGVDVSHLVISLSSMTLAFAFIFGNSLRTVYESVVFLFVVRPYKVGARALLQLQPAVLRLKVHQTQDAMHIRTNKVV